jgi:hypothetical protein
MICGEKSLLLDGEETLDNRMEAHDAVM